MLIGQRDRHQGFQLCELVQTIRLKELLMDVSKRREMRKQELEQMSLDQLGEVRPYKKNEVTASKTDPSNPQEMSKEEMIETILSHEGLGRR